MKKLLILTAALLVSVTLSVVVSTVPAQAAPSGCTKGGGYTYATAKCTRGTGSYQAYAVCANYSIPGATFKKFVQSSWFRVGSKTTASVSCPVLYVVESRGVGIRN